MKIWKTAAIFTALALLLSLPALGADEPGTSAQSAILMEAETGDTLWAKNPDSPMLIASTTKIMTALVVIERGDLDRAVTVDPSWTGIEGSSMYLRPGQELTVRELLYGMMLASGNDAAVALACVTAGSVEDFAALMNEKAAALGCVNTHFANPNGLDEEGHYSSARDLALITREAISYEDFREIVSCQSKTIGEQTYTNHNRLLRECEGVFGVKTGYTEAAGRSLVTCCERDGLTLICVTLSDADDWNDHAALYGWAYESYVREQALSPADIWTVPVIGGTEREVTVSPEGALSVYHRAEDTVRVELALPSFVYAQVSSGEEAGQATAYINGEPAGQVRLVFTGDVARQEESAPTFWERLRALFTIGERKIYTLS